MALIDMRFKQQANSMRVALDGYFVVVILLSADPLPRVSVKDGSICICARVPPETSP